MVQAEGEREARREQDAELVRRSLAGEQKAFEVLVRVYHERIFRLVYYRLRSQADAEDLVQEVFVKAYRKLHKLQEPGSFMSWLYSIAVNSVRDHGRKRSLRAMFLSEAKDGEIEIPDSGGMENVEKNAFWRHVDKLSNLLGAREREVFLLRFLDGLEIKEIAAVINRSEGTVKTSLHRAVAKFRQDEALRGFLQGEQS